MKLHQYPSPVYHHSSKSDDFPCYRFLYGPYGTCFGLCAALIIICGLFYIPLFLSVRHAIKFDWSITSNRNITSYIRPEWNTTLIQPKLINGSGCPRSSILILVHSAVKNFDIRNAIRLSWGKYATDNDTIILFIVGRNSSSDSDSLYVNLMAENEVHGDIIQEDFIDLYSNLTLKSIMMLKWTAMNCDSVKYLIKSDEDMFINVPNLIDYLSRLPNSNRFIGGALICKAQPLKDKYSKYYSPVYMYNRRYFPNYVSGTSYIISGDLIRELFRTALTVPLYHLEDIYLTGICAEKLGVKPRDVIGFSYEHRPLDPCLFRKIIAAHYMNFDRLGKIWKLMHSPGIEQRCNRTKISKLRTYKPYNCKR